jgi:hypothetical protein
MKISRKLSKIQIKGRLRSVKIIPEMADPLRVFVFDLHQKQD